MTHPEEVPYQGGIVQLAIDLGDLRYDALARFLALLRDKIYRDASQDLERRRTRLAAELFGAAEDIAAAVKHIEEAWRLSKPHMPHG